MRCPYFKKIPDIASLTFYCVKIQIIFMWLLLPLTTAAYVLRLGKVKFTGAEK